MERSNKRRSRRDRDKARRAPKVPIKTYRWEDIRRARRKGGYPWTYLYKAPFTDKIDPEQFTMDALRRAKSSSPMGKRSDRIDISEVSSWADYSGKTTPTLLHELISEPEENISKKGSRPSSVLIEEFVEDEEDDVQVKEFHTESVGSSDNISQYLDKDEQGPATLKVEEAKTPSESGREKRAKSEEIAARKRKLSAESGHSRYSLSKLGVLKKLQEAKNKIKVPKLSFPTKKIARKRSSPPKGDKPNKEVKKTQETSRVKKLDKPVYIHIPLKPPPGETDEFSHLEFEAKQKNGISTSSVEQVSPNNVPAEKIEQDIVKEETKDNEEANEEIKDKSPFSTLEKGPKVTTKPPLNINPAFKQFLKDVRQLKEKDLVKETEENKIIEETKPEECKVENATANEDVVMDLEEQHTSDSESPRDDIFDKLFQASFSKKDDDSGPTNEPSESSTSRNVRSKSAEPQNKRRSSMDSGHSRKSLSKLGIMKKLKDASEKIKSALSMENLRKKVLKQDEPSKPPKDGENEKPKKPKPSNVIKSGQFNKPKDTKPVYIHIPLKLPEGQTDEFSHLQSEPIAPEVKTAPLTDSLDSSSPGSPQKDDIHFIFLTPPSDDEILDEKEPDIPETPSSSSDDMVFFSSLKQLAQDVVSQVSPETGRKTLEPVREESVSDKGSTGEIENIDSKDATLETAKVDQEQAATEAVAPSAPTESEEKIIVDVEDGLNETAKTEEHLKSALKTTTETASAKRVSFKRKSKVPKEKDKNSDKGYETIETPKNEEPIKDIQKPEAAAEIDRGNQTSPIEENTVPSEELENKESILVGDISSQSVSVDEEKSCLDRVIGKDPFLEEDNNKWSNVLGDHEYEPINPPDETTMRISSVLPNVTVVDGDTGDPKVVISATDILDKPIEEKKKPFFQFGSFRKHKPQDEGQDQGSSSDTHSRSSQGRELPEVEDRAKPSEGPNKFQMAFKHGTEQLKTKTNELRNKLHNIKKPNIHLPKAPQFKKPDLKKPDFKRFKIEKPKFNLHLPKIPDTASIHLPHISLPGAKKTTQTRTVETRQFSTESNADDSEQQTKRHKFDLSFGGTFPRFRKKQKPDQEVAFATVPRAKKKVENISTTTVSSDTSSIRIPLHSEDSTDAAERLNLEEATETSVDVARLSGRRFSGDVSLEVEYERENQAINRADYLSRWQHGNFKERKDDEDNEDERIVGHLVEQRFGRGGEGHVKYKEQEDRVETLEERLRRDEERPRYVEDDEEEEFDIRLMHNKHMVTDLDNLDDDPIGQIRDGYSSEGSVSLQRKGRLGKLDIDSDEFFVVHEIREGFQTPANALTQMNEYDPIGSNRSLPMQMQQESRKPIKKPKRKKTPHVSQEQIPGDEESLEGVITPSRPKRRSKRTKKKPEKDETVVPYQQTIPLDTDLRHGQRLDFPRESLGILGDDEQEFDMYEKERMQGKNQPNILASDPYKQFQDVEQRKEKEEPRIPPRKHRSLKSLTQSENESILTDTRYDDDRNLEDQIISAQPTPPRRSSRRSRSHTSSLSRISLPPSPRDTDSVFTDEGYLVENQQIPSYLIENQNYKQLYEDQPRQPCVEEPCVQDLRDYMGYSIVDKSKCREPPLPPPRTPPRRRKRSVDPEQKFATVPRHVGSSDFQAPPVRPLRNYSTLSHMRESRNSSSPYANDNENKENEVDSGQYIEIDDDANRDLVSGDVVQKMRQRPLPAPPRPPRKQKTTRKSLQDITSKENIILSGDLKTTPFQEETVSTQTEPLPPDFICEEIKQEPTDTIITPRQQETIGEPTTTTPIERFDIYDPRTREPAQIRRELITPTVYSFEETVTHGTLLVQPIDGAKVLPDHQMSERGRSVPITKEFSDEDETSEIPESFKKLRNPEDDRSVIHTVKVSDMDVDRLTVNELLASKLVVSEVDSSTIATDEIQAKSGSLKVTNVELPPQFLEQLMRQLEVSQPSKTLVVSDQEDSAGQKKTSINIQPLDTVELPSQLHTTRIDSIEQHLHQERQDVQRRESSIELEKQHFSPEPPVPPPRSCTLDEAISPDAPPRTLQRRSKQDSPRLTEEQPLSPLRTEMLEPEVDDQPPPRPPQPSEGLYLPSQPPPSFYALRAKQYVDDNIPTAPRRKRHQSVRSRPVSRSRSTSDDSSSPPHRPSRLPRRSSEPSISELSGRLIQACGTRINNSLKRLIYRLTANLLRNADGEQDLHVFMVILLVLIAGLILLGYGEDRTVVHLHHWEYFNPPKDL